MKLAVLKGAPCPRMRNLPLDQDSMLRPTNYNLADVHLPFSLLTAAATSRPRTTESISTSSSWHRSWAPCSQAGAGTEQRSKKSTMTGVVNGEAQLGSDRPSVQCCRCQCYEAKEHLTPSQQLICSCTMSSVRSTLSRLSARVILVQAFQSAGGRDYMPLAWKASGTSANDRLFNRHYPRLCKSSLCYTFKIVYPSRGCTLSWGVVTRHPEVLV